MANSFINRRYVKNKVFADNKSIILAPDLTSSNFVSVLKIFTLFVSPHDQQDCPPKPKTLLKRTYGVLTTAATHSTPPSPNVSCDSIGTGPVAPCQAEIKQPTHKISTNLKYVAFHITPDAHEHNQTRTARHLV